VHLLDALGAGAALTLGASYAGAQIAEQAQAGGLGTVEVIGVSAVAVLLIKEVFSFLSRREDARARELSAKEDAAKKVVAPAGATFTPETFERMVRAEEATAHEIRSMREDIRELIKELQETQCPFLSMDGAQRVQQFLGGASGWRGRHDSSKSKT
jgi:hypothetical protein